MRLGKREHAGPETRCHAAERPTSYQVWIGYEIPLSEQAPPGGPTINIVAKPSALRDVSIGDILELLSDASVPTGLYQVIEFDGDDILLAHVHSNDYDLAAVGGLPMDAPETAD